MGMKKTDYVERFKIGAQAARRQEAREIRKLLPTASAKDTGWMRDRLAVLAKEIRANVEFDPVPLRIRPGKKALVVGDLVIREGIVRLLGERVGTLMHELELGYHPVVRLRLDGYRAIQYELDGGKVAERAASDALALLDGMDPKALVKGRDFRSGRLV